MKTMTSPPLPIPVLKRNFLVGNTFQFTRDPLGFLSSLQRQYDRLVTMRLVGRDIHLVLTPDDAKHILQENNRNYVKSEAYRVLSIFLGNGLLTSEGDFWRRQRRLAQPAFYKNRLAGMTAMMNAEIMDWLGELKRHDLARPVDVSVELMNLTLRIVTKALFSTDVKERLAGLSEPLNTIIHFAHDTLTSFVRVPLTYPTPRNLAFKKAVQRVEGIIYEIINGRRAELARNPEARYDDLLGMLMEARDEDTGETMTDRQLRDEVTTLFMAGHETTAAALGWALYLLARHPEIQREVRQEVRQVLGPDGLPTYDTLRELRYTSQVVQETMRLYPPAWVIGRRSREADQLGPHALPPNSYVFISPYLLHRDPAHWEFPTAFHPDHFRPERVRDRPTYAYLPFGGGPRICIGNNFALMEMQLVLALAVRAFDFQPVREVLPDASVTLRPKGGVPLRLRAA